MRTRVATVADAPALARVHLAAWRSAYVGVMPDAFLAELDEARFTRGWVRNLDEAAAVTIVGLTDSDRIDGFASYGDARDEDPPAAAELWALNLHPVAFGTGLAIALEQHALSALAASGHDAAYLWAARENLRALRFYEREGWSPDRGAREQEFGGVPVAEVRYIKELTT